MRCYKDQEKGEILTILTLATLLIIGAVTVVSSVFVSNKNPKQVTSSHACIPGDPSCDRRNGYGNTSSTEPDATTSDVVKPASGIQNLENADSNSTTTSQGDTTVQTTDQTSGQRKAKEMNSGPATTTIVTTSTVTDQTSPQKKSEETSSLPATTTTNTTSTTQDSKAKLAQEFVQNPGGCMGDPACKNQIEQNFGTVPGANDTSWKCNSPSDPNCDKCGYAGWNPSGCITFTKPDPNRQVNPQGTAPKAWNQRNADICGSNVDGNGNCITPTPVPNNTNQGGNGVSPWATPVPVVTIATGLGDSCYDRNTGVKTPCNSTITQAPGVTLPPVGSAQCCDANGKCLTSLNPDKPIVMCPEGYTPKVIISSPVPTTAPDNNSCVSIYGEGHANNVSRTLFGTCPPGFKEKNTGVTTTSPALPTIVVPTVPYGSNVKAVTIDTGFYRRKIGMSPAEDWNDPNIYSNSDPIDASTISICTDNGNGNYSCNNPVAKQQLGNSSVYYVQYNALDNKGQLICANIRAPLKTTTGMTCFILK